MKKLALALSALAAASAAHAVEPFATYDNFRGSALDLTRWVETERVREIERGQLRLVQRNLGANTGDAGASFINFNENLANPTVVTALKAKITVNAFEVNACAANTTPGQSRARIVGSFFNTGTPTPGSQLGDVIAQVRITRFSNSADPAGVLRVQGLVSLCTSADCNAASVIGNIVDLGTVNVGQATTVQLQWDQPGRSFLFARETGASGAVGYTEPDTTPPSVAFKQLSTRMDLPNCQTAPRVAGSVDASFDNVAVNKSAAP